MLDFDDGVHLIGTGVFLDARRVRDRAIVTHAHRDHVAQHRRWVASPATAALCARRWGAAEVEVHRFHEPWEEDGARVTLLPAGHILGSSMVLVERAGTRILYTGDFRLRPAATAEACRPVTADVLVMECTYGVPRYRFPERREELDRVGEFVARARRVGAVPILTAYSLGKAQEIARLMGERGVKVRLHSDAWEMLEVYRAFGIDFPGCSRFEPEAPIDGVLVLPPGRSGRELMRRFRRRHVAFLSGWALDPWRRMPFRGTGFVISDHADYDELLELVDQVGARKIYTLHGPDSFAARLRRRGHDAEAAAMAMQGSLF